MERSSRKIHQHHSHHDRSTWGNNASSKYQGPQWKNYQLNVVKNIITYETNDEQVVTKVRMGVVDAGFAYMTDAVFYGQSNSSQLKYVQIPSDVNIKAQYGIGVLKNSTHTELAMKYLNFWISNDGQNLLTKYGFGNTLPTMSISTEIVQFQKDRHNVHERGREEHRSAITYRQICLITEEDISVWGIGAISLEAETRIRRSAQR